MYRKILIPFDGSPEARHAIETAVGMADDKGELTVFQCFDPIFYEDFSGVEHGLGGAIHDAAIDAAVNSARDATIESNRELLEAAAESSGKDLSCLSDGTVGSAAELIAEYAESNGFDLIVMGRRGIGGVKALLGSVSLKVLRKTELPVLVVR